jgi:uncharacterized protein (DUF433 family)
MTEVVRDLELMDGDPTVEGTGILAETIMSYLRSGYSPEEIRQDYPSLPADGIDAVVRWAARRYGPNWRTRT